MSSRKKDLEIVYNLEWKNKPANGDEKSNMVGILDIPATTLDWQTFKSYLLKNSGAADDNVKVSYIDSEEREKAINSQLDFEIALYTFRHKARMGEIITLKLDCINNKKTSNSVKSIAKGLVEVQVKMKPKIKKTEEPPEWFLIYMKKFKDELLEEISTICSSKAHQMNLYHARKLKADSYKRTRKAPLLLGDAMNDKELSKSAKIERKLESKLEKLEHKTMKIKAKKMALRGSSDSDVGRSSSKNETSTYLPQNNNNDMSMNASVIKKEITPHMSGGEPYCQTWEVCNRGTLPWTSDTELRYAWGSQALKPLNKEVPCPPLLPGEKGCISVFLEIPKTPGTYECYWHFYHKGRRFGHWLGCDIIVDDPPVKNVPFIPAPTYDVISIQDMYELVLPTTWTTQKAEKPTENNTNDAVNAFNPNDLENPFADAESQKCAPMFTMVDFDNNQSFVKPNEEESKDLADGKNDLKGDINTFSDSDNQSIVSISDSSVNTATSEDFVVLKMSSSPPNLEKGATANDFETALPSLTKMNVSSLENIDNIDNLFTKLSMDEANPPDLQIDRADEPNKEDEIEKDGVASMSNEQETSVKNLSNTASIVQQIPIDLSNKANTNGEVNEGGDTTGYAYVHYKGRKIPISKKHLRSEYLATAECVPASELKKVGSFKMEVQATESEEASVKYTSEEIFRTSTPSVDVNDPQPHPLQLQSETKPVDCNQSSCYSLPATAGTDFGSNCGMNSSMCSSVNENRFFVFPQYYPGYEVVPVLVNDWTTGRNYADCLRYPNPQNQYYNTVGNNTSNNTSRGCSSIPNSAAGSPPYQSPQSTRDGGINFKAETSTVSSCNGHCVFEQYVNVNSGSFDDTARGNLYTSSASNCSSSDNVQSSASNQPKAQTQDSRTNNRVGVPDLLSGATVMATSAMNTARTVFNMFVPPKSSDCGRWHNGHWISTNPESKREKNLRLLHEMGFYNRDLNATLLARYHDDLNMVISELLE